MGMLAGSNDTELMERTKNGRDINRHYYTADEVEQEQNRKIVRDIKELMELRNSHPAFNLDGEISVEANDDKLVITRKYKDSKITLEADLSTYDFNIL